MFKKLVIIMMLFMDSSCVAMSSPRGAFLEFINAKIAEGLETVRAKIIENSEGTGQFKNLSKAFEDNFGKCFVGTALEAPISHLHSNTLFSAAQTLGLAFLERGQTRRTVEDLDVAIAFFKSIPRNFNKTTEGETFDTCIVDFVDITEKEKRELEDRQEKLHLLEMVDLSSFQ
jgi:hypothetical protein